MSSLDIDEHVSHRRRRRIFGRIAWIMPLSMLGCIATVALFAPLLSSQDPYDKKILRLEDSELPPIWLRELPGETETETESGLRYLLGTDANGRDMISAVLFGLRVSLLVGLLGTIIAMVLGTTLGLIAGYAGGKIETIIMRMADIQLSFPSILIALFMMAVWGQGLEKIIIAVGIVHWVIYARLVRGSVLAEREKDYIAAIRAMGGGPGRIIFRHLLPNITGPIVVVSAVQFASIVMLEATLSYLGLGTPVDRPSLGMLIKFGYDYFHSGYWWIWFFPGFALMLLVLSINWLADSLGRAQT